MAENKWVTGVITPIKGVITLLITSRGPPCTTMHHHAILLYFSAMDSAFAFPCALPENLPNIKRLITDLPIIFPLKAIKKKHIENNAIQYILGGNLSVRIRSGQFLKFGKTSFFCSNLLRSNFANCNFTSWKLLEKQVEETRLHHRNKLWVTDLEIHFSDFMFFVARLHV